MKVLVVEDDIIIAMTISDMLKEAGHSVIGPVSTAGAALEWAWADVPDFALINIDLADEHKGTDLARTLLGELGIGSYFVSGNLSAAKEAADASLGVHLKAILPEDAPGEPRRSARAHERGGLEVAQSARRIGAVPPFSRDDAVRAASPMMSRARSR